MDFKQKTDDTEKPFGDREHIQSPEELTAYIRLVRPGTLILVLALALVFVALIIWGCTGTLPVTKSVNGVMTTIEKRMNNSFAHYHRDYFEAEKSFPKEKLERYDAYFFLNAYEYSGEDLLGKEIIVSCPGKAPIKGTITLVEPEPYDRDEIRAEFDAEWIVNTCVESDYSWVVAGTLDSDTYDKSWSLVDITVVTENVRPISFLFRQEEYPWQEKK